MSAINAVVLIGLFVLGCIAIHGLRQHTKRITQVLTLVVLSLGPFTLLVALAMQPTPTHRGGVSGAAQISKRPMTHDTRAEPSTASGHRLAQTGHAKRQGEPTADGSVPDELSDEQTRTALPEQDASPDGTGEMPGSPASKNAERIK